MAAPVAPALPKSPVAPPTPTAAKKDDSDFDPRRLLAAEPLAKFPGETEESAPTPVAAEPIIESLDDDIVADLDVAEVAEEPVTVAEPVIEAEEIAEAEIAERNR